MISVIKDKEHLTQFLHNFYQHVQYLKQQEPGITPHKLVTGFLDNEERMEHGMNEYYDSLVEIEKKNQALLSEIRKEKGKTFYKHLLQVIEDSDRVDGLMEIVAEPVGKYQKETEYGRQIKGIWVDQWSVGMEGDSWNGIVCVELGPNRYLKFNYSM